LAASWPSTRAGRTIARSIDTLVTLDVAEYLKGSWGSPLQFRVPGGELGRYPQHPGRRTGIRH